MKNYSNKIIICLASAAVSMFFVASNANAQERDPFSPSGNGVVGMVKNLVSDDDGKKSKKSNFNSTKPLTSSQISSYKVIGVISSKDYNEAAVKAINGLTYYINVGDNLGSEGGKVSAISINGVTIQTESDEINMPVNNKIEVPIEDS